MTIPHSSALTLAFAASLTWLVPQAHAADLDELPPPPAPVLNGPVVAGPPAPTLRGDFQAIGGAYAVDSGYADRAFMGLQGSLYDETGFGVHFDAVHVQREEDAAFVAVGASYAVTPGTRLKLMLGSSSDNLEVQPELYVNGSATLDFGPQSGVVVTPEIIYRSYRNGVDEVQAQANVSKYFSPFADGSYLVGSINGSVNHVSPGDNIGWEAGAGVIYVRPRTMSVGLSGVVGSSAYDNQLGLASVGVRNDYAAVRPSVSMYLSPDVEVFARAEYLWTDFYDLAGGYAGIKYTF